MNSRNSHALVGLAMLAVGVLIGQATAAFLASQSRWADQDLRTKELQHRLAQLEIENSKLSESERLGQRTISRKQQQLVRDLGALGMETFVKNNHAQAGSSGVVVRWFSTDQERIGRLQLAGKLWPQEQKAFSTHAKLVGQSAGAVFRSLEISEDKADSALEWFRRVLSGPECRTYQDFGDIRIAVDTFHRDSRIRMSLECYPRPEIPPD